jgi:glycosyltransferase involved in cell wall biosynthesis
MISVVIPTYNRPKYLLNCLASLMMQKVSIDWEVLVIDDGSDKNIEPLLNSLPEHGRIRYFWQENAGPASARNRGVELAKFPYVAFLDDDCCVDENWLQVLSENCEKGVLLGGRIENGCRENDYSKASQLLVSFLYEFFEGTNHYFFTSNNFLVDKESFLSVKGFDECFNTSAGEDREFCVRWLHLGNQLTYLPNALVIHYHFQTLKLFIKLHFKYGEAAIPFRKKMKKIGVSLTLNKTGFYTEMTKYWARQSYRSKGSKYAILIYLAISQMANVFGNFSGVIKSR